MTTQQADTETAFDRAMRIADEEQADEAVLLEIMRRRHERAQQKAAIEQEAARIRQQAVAQEAERQRHEAEAAERERQEREAALLREGNGVLARSVERDAADPAAILNTAGAALIEALDVMLRQSRVLLDELPAWDAIVRRAVPLHQAGVSVTLPDVPLVLDTSQRQLLELTRGHVERVLASIRTPEPKRVDVAADIWALNNQRG